jgi:hypothetical protein
MVKGKHIDSFTNSPGCRAKASALRTISAMVMQPDFKARMLTLALKLEARADTYDLKS